MPLTVAQIKELLDNPVSRTQITTAVAHERRLRLHAETTLNHASNQAVTDFLHWIDTLIPVDKAAIFKALFRYPVKSVALTDQIFAALEKVFDGRNPVRLLNFQAAETEADAKEYLQEIDFKDTWRFKSFERMKTAINSVMICDLPSEQEGPRPAPYWYFLDIDHVLDFDMEDDGSLEWIAFFSDEDKLAYFDREYYQVFQLKDARSREVVGIASEAPHDLGYCPARFFWSTPINHREPVTKRAPLTPELSNLDWWLFHAISKQHLDMYASYPIYWGYEQDCDYEDHVTGRRCDGGFLKDPENVYLVDRQNGSLLRCPVCTKSRLNGAGSYNEVPAPIDRESADLRDPVGIIGIDSASLEYNVKEHNRLTYEIYTNVTGYGGEPINDQAINEKQVLASFEGRGDVLKKLKKEFERAESWLLKTICRLRYGASFVSASVDYGTEFYLYTPAELLEMYTEGRKAGLSDQILDMLQDQYYETKFRNNPEMMARIEILTALEPFRHLTKAEVRGLYDAGMITFEEFYLKVNFSNLIDRFERENINIVEFGSEIEFDAKINAIKKTLYDYGKENQPQQVRQPAGGSEGGSVAA